MSKKHMFTPEEFLQEQNINSHYEQDRIRKLASKFLNKIIENRHFLKELQEECTHPNKVSKGATDDLETYYDYTCLDCHKTWRENGKVI
jgi:hypothetical protein